jgi:hypothetical protein
MLLGYFSLAHVWLRLADYNNAGFVRFDRLGWSLQIDENDQHIDVCGTPRCNREFERA